MTATTSRIKRALYRASHRGTKELDLMLGRFADAELQRLSEAELGAFEALLALPDPQIDGWIKGDAPPPAIGTIIEKIRRYHGLED